ncbi:AAA family ATPase [Xanthomarina gelatinilytica]|uniref:AAA family ATPase n=1 Tax=Xanthomarina gelatinilytica TaxID=1137281 RepID=UPI003AA92B2E
MVDKVKRAIIFREMFNRYKKRPPDKFLVRGIKIGSFGLVFGPSKSAKTTYCEYLALCIACGRNDLLGDKIDIPAQKVLFLGLEEFWANRVSRNLKQYNSLSDAEKKLYEKNFLYQPLDFLRFIQKDKDWKELKKLVEDSNAKFVFIDSITRMNHGNLEDSKIAQEIMQKLRDICYSLNITLVCIHHTPKMYGKSITMDSIKGSSVFAQESDFAIGINQFNKRRYQKDVFFRYISDDTETVKEFKVDENVCVKLIQETSEYEILNGEDRRKTDDKRETFLEYFKERPCKEHKTSDIVKHFMTTFSIKDRQVKNYLKEFTANKSLVNLKKGIYVYSGCDSLRKEAKND